jgi:C4-dicarboxylate-specific signal transduction histidine kinase
VAQLDDFSKILQEAESDTTDQFAELARLSFAGKLVSAFGHEVNNPLAVATGNLELLEMAVKKIAPEDEKIHSRLTKTRNNLDRISDLVQGFRSLANLGREAKKDETDVSTIIESANGLLVPLFAKDDVAIKYDRPSKPFSIDAKCSDIQAAYLGLMLKALEVAKVAKSCIEVKLNLDEKLLTVGVNTDLVQENEKVTKEKQFDYFVIHTIAEQFGASIEVDANDSALRVRLMF